MKAVWWEQPTGTEELMEGGWFVQLADEEFGTAIAYDLPMALHYLEVLYPPRVAA